MALFLVTSNPSWRHSFAVKSAFKRKMFCFVHYTERVVRYKKWHETPYIAVVLNSVSNCGKYVCSSEALISKLWYTQYTVSSEMSLAYFNLKRISSASCGFLAAARLSCFRTIATGQCAWHGIPSQERLCRHSYHYIGEKTWLCSRTVRTIIRLLIIMFV